MAAPYALTPAARGRVSVMAARTASGVAGRAAARAPAAAAGRNSLGSAASSVAGVKVAGARRSRVRRASVAAQANELNRWASPDGGEGEEDGDEVTDSYDRDTMSLFTRTLTARAAQKLLMDLMETDELAAQWLNNFIADAQQQPHTGDAFIAELLAQRTVLVAEPGCPPGPLAPPLRELSPGELARRLLAQRKAMAARIFKKATFPAHVEAANMKVLRAHLMKSTYVSGK